MKRPIAFAALIGAIASSPFVTSPASAEGTATDSASAQALFDLGKKLMAKKNYDEACPKLAESQRLDPGTGTLLNLADCYERAGKLASAWSTYLETAASARTAGQPDRERLARTRAAALAPRLSNVIVNVAPEDANVEALEVQRDGTPVGAPQFGVPVPADTGDHTLAASAPGRKPWQTTFTVPDKAQTVTVVVPALEALPAPPPPSPPPVVVVPAPEPPAQSRSWFSTHQRTAAIVVGSVGVVGVGIGTVFGLMAKPTYNKSNPYCNGDHCDPPGHDYRQSAFDKADIANVAFAVGGIALLGGAALWLTAPKAYGTEKPSSATIIAPAVGPKAAFVSLNRTW